MALILFGALFLLLFAGYAIAEGLSGPSVPSGDVAHVSDIQDEFANISKEQLDASMARLDTGKKPTEPGSDKYEEIKTEAMTELVEGIWLRGEAEEFGIEVTDKQVEAELETIKEQNFPTEAAFNKFLKDSNFTREEVNDLVELQILGRDIQELVNAQAPPPSSSAIEAYYEAEKASQFTTKESRDVRTIINKDKAKVEAAKQELEKDSSPDAWKKAAATYSIDPTSKKKGGLQEGISEEFVEGPLRAAIFDSATGELVGPVKFQENYILLEVVKLNPAKVQTLKEAKGQIEQTLSQETQQEFFTEFAAGYREKWAGRTVCASDYEIPQCGNYVGDGRPQNAPPACFEEDPKTPAEACPALVTPTSPALPGSVTERKPKGEPFPQRPLPEVQPEQGEEVPTGAPPGTPPPSGATGE
ncbi:MAG TPA: peptidyl-prolyl cis-trans isomerase [Solirubrobacterales bacterium]|nr:peptidyl-prolyl cis-trans isomerase [Solirubrobacterales bacterium]